ncbi:hypothetical protein ABBQ38_009704 [Trebouxia sp. C0009 RCD-2024]
MRASPQCILLFIGLLLGAISVSSYPVEGRLRLPVFADQNVKGSKIKLVLSLNGGYELQAFPTIDGSFLFPEVPAGTHMLDVVCVDLLFPQVRLDVDGGTGSVAAAYANNPMQGLPSPLIIRPLARAEYFERRPPFNLASIIMSPYGLMIGFMVFALFIMPMLKVDPEEYKELMGTKQEALPNASSESKGLPQQRLQ